MIRNWAVALKQNPNEPKHTAPQPTGPVRDFVSGRCKWIYGEPDTADWRCCGRPRRHGDSRYCDFHARKSANNPEQETRFVRSTRRRAS
jgi:hypothetical protein